VTFVGARYHAAMTTTTTRRTFLATSLAVTAYAALPRDARAVRIPGSEPLLNLHERFDKPVAIDSVELLKAGKNHYVRVKSADGAFGACVGNSRLGVTVDMARQLVFPYFTGKDARDIESLADGVYTERDDRGSVYKFAGMPFWNIVGHVEAAIFDLLGRTAGMPVHDLLGGAKRDRVDVYISQFARGPQRRARSEKDRRPRHEAEGRPPHAQHSRADATRQTHDRARP